MVVSTNCKGCSVYLRVDGLKVTVPSLSSSAPRYQAKSSIPEDPHPANAPMARSTEAKAPPPSPAPTKEEKKALKPGPSKPDLTPSVEKVAPAKAPLEKKPASPPSKTEVEKSPKEPAKTPSAEPKVKTFPKIINTPQDKESLPVAESNSTPEPAQSSSPSNAPAAQNPVAKHPSKPKAPPAPAKPAHLDEDDKADIPESPPSRYRPDTPKESEPAHRQLKLINREKKRSVLCFECDRAHEILADSTSALCPHCGAYIGLKNYDIRDQVNSRIQTRGDVFVHKKGAITGITIQCHNLIIEGDIKGGAECSGDFILRKNGKINGPVTSDRIIIERRAVVSFMSTVKAREIIIDGEVTGSVSCKKLVLKKRATLDGDLVVGTLSVEDGARHTGQIQMIPS